METNENVIQWLKRWSSLIRELDYESSLLMFDESVFGFGTVATRTSGKNQLLNHQWRQVWGNTTEFDFDYSSITVRDFGTVFVVGALWSSWGIDAGNNEKYSREGRATIILQVRDGELQCVHTHFSINPEKERFL